MAVRQPADVGTVASRVPLVERDRELVAIASALDRARDGKGAVLAIVGQAGEGKTRLLAEARKLAQERGYAVLAARGAELERGFAFGVVRQVFERCLSQADESERERLLAGVAAPLLPLFDGPPSEEPSSADQLFPLIHGVYWLTSRLSEAKPLLLTIDDLHWADEPSRGALAYLAARVDDRPVVLATAIRAEGLSAADEASGLVGLLANAEELQLDTLSEGGAALLLRKVLGGATPAFSGAAHHATGGNPHLLRELAVAIAIDGLDPVDEAVRRIAELAPRAAGDWALARLSHVGGPATRLANSVAVLQTADLALAAAHASLSVEEAEQAADLLCGAAICEAALPLRINQPLVQEALYRRMAPGARAAAHRRAALLLADLGAPPEAIAAHLLECGPVGEPFALDALRSAARAAMAGGHAGEVVWLLRRAMQEPGGADDPSLLLQMGAAEEATADAAAIEHLETAASRCPEPRLRLAARAMLATVRLFTGDFAGSFDEAVATLAEVPPGSGGPDEARAFFGLLAARHTPELVDRVRAQLRTPRLGPNGEITPAELARLALRGADAVARGEREVGEQTLLGVASHVAERPPDQSASVFAYGVTGLALSWLGRFELADDLTAKYVEVARRSGSALELTSAFELRVAVHYRRGQVGRALADAATFFTLAADANAYDEALTVPTRVLRAHLLLEHGEVEAARESLALPSGVEGRLRGMPGWVWLPYGRSWLAAAEGEWSLALQQALLCGERAIAIQSPSPDWAAWRPLAARAAAHLGQRERAIELASEEVSWGRRIGSPRATGSGLCILGTISGDADGVGMLIEAVEQFDAAGVELERARARVELGMALRRCRRPRDARQPLREGIDLASRIGATELATRGRSELQAAGGRPRRERTTGPEALTPREREIAELAAAGQSNPEIAHALYISRRTVDAHLRNVYAKLEIGSREELPKGLTEASRR